VVECSLRATSALHEYTSNTRNASNDRKLLVEETSSLSHTLKKLRIRAVNARSDDQWLERRTDLVRQLSRAYDDLATTLNVDTSAGRLKSESRSRAVWNVAKWSFTKAETYSLLERVTRLQLYANTLLLDEQHLLVERIDQRQQDDHAAKQLSAISEWLTPLQMAHTHETISRRPGKDSGRWFLTSPEFRAWQGSLKGLLWCPGIRMFFDIRHFCGFLTSLSSWSWKDCYGVKTLFKLFRPLFANISKMYCRRLSTSPAVAQGDTY
jgi:hypothetical protein